MQGIDDGMPNTGFGVGRKVSSRIRKAVIAYSVEQPDVAFLNKVGHLEVLKGSFAVLFIRDSDDQSKMSFEKALLRNGFLLSILLRLSGNNLLSKGTYLL